MRLARLYDQPPICMELEGLLPVEQGPRLTVDGDAVPRADEGRTAGSLFGPHVVDTIGGQQGVIQMVAGQQRVHGLGFGGIARRIQGKAIEPEHKADADGGVVVLVAGGHGFDLDITQGESAVPALVQGLFPGDDGTARLAGRFVDLIVVVVVVGHQDQISGHIIALAGIGVDVDHLAAVGLQAVAAVALISQCRHVA